MHPLVEWLRAPAEQTGLPDGLADVVVSVTAFHWFQPLPAAREAARLLRCGGRLAVMATDRDPEDPVAAAFHTLIGEVEAGITPENIAAWYGHAFLPETFGPVRRVVADNPQRFSLERLLARAASSSYWPSDLAAQEQARQALAALWERFATFDGSERILKMQYRAIGLLAERL
jgi:SAM-dependent methyltransferase